VPERFTALLILLPTVAVGVAIRLWRGRARESAERLRRAEAEHEAQTRRAVEQERARIASEMHDVVTHNVSVMVVQAGAARRVLDSSPEDAREALLAVEASGRTAMTELRYLLGLLAPADGDAVGAGGSWAGVGRGDLALAPQPGVARIPDLLARVCAAGMPVELVVDPADGTEPTLPPGVDLAAFRVVQEALTNVMKHAGATRAVVRLGYRPRDLLITVTDDGPPPGSAPVAQPSGYGGRGLIGLHERIAVYGGELDAGPRAGGGWRLMARIPVAEAAPGSLAVAPEFLGAAR
jgi:signal transduction histidine kinase